MNLSRAVFRVYRRGVLIIPLADLLPDVVGRNRECRSKEGSIHVPNFKSFLVTEAERKHVRRRARFQQHSCFLPGRAKDLSAPPRRMVK